MRNPSPCSNDLKILSEHRASRSTKKLPMIENFFIADILSKIHTVMKIRFVFKLYILNEINKINEYKLLKYE